MKFLWYRDKTWLLEKPSIDRIDSYGDYTFDNCRFIEFKENAMRPNIEINSKPVLQYNLNNKFIKEYESISEAGRRTNICLVSISYVANNKRKTAGGYKWEFKYEQS